MNLKYRLLHLVNFSSRDRRTGRTTLIAKAAKEVGGIVLAATHRHAKDIERTYGVPSKSYQLNLEGFSGPVFFDHFAIESILVRAHDKIESKEKEIESIKESHEKLKKTYYND